MRKQIVPGFEPWRKVVKEKQQDPHCRACGGTGWEDYGEPIWGSWTCSSCMSIEEESAMGQDVLRSYHEELVQKLRNYEEILNPGFHSGYNSLIREIEAALSSCREQLRTPHQPLQGQPIENS